MSSDFSSWSMLAAYQYQMIRPCGRQPLPNMIFLYQPISHSLRLVTTRPTRPVKLWNNVDLCSGPCRIRLKKYRLEPASSVAMHHHISMRSPDVWDSHVPSRTAPGMSPFTCVVSSVKASGLPVSDVLGPVPNLYLAVRPPYPAPFLRNESGPAGLLLV